MPIVGKVCSRCVLDESDPNIVFDAAGVCNYCKQYDVSASRLLTRCSSKKLDQKIKLIKKEGNDKEYDAIVGVSGGVDSSYVLYKAVKEYGLRVLALHVDAGWNSEIAVRNIHRAVEKLDVDLYTHVVDWNAMRDVQAAFFRASVVNCDIPQDHSFKAIQYQVAKKFGIRHFISGRNTATDSMMPSRWVWSNDDGYHIRNIHKRFGRSKIDDYPLYSAWYGNVYVPYFAKYEDFRILDFSNYKRLEAKNIISKELDWSDYGGKHYESIFTEFYQGYYLPEKFGFDKRKAHLSGLINNGEITRDQALRELSDEPLSPKRVKELKRYVLKKLSFSEGEWDQVMDEKEISHTEYPNQVVMIDNLKNMYRSIRDIFRRN